MGSEIEYQMKIHKARYKKQEKKYIEEGNVETRMLLSFTHRTHCHRE